jgi:hypothetical protein
LLPVLFVASFLQPTAVLELPTEADVLGPTDVQLPNAQYSSDHIALLCEFQYLRPATGGGSAGGNVPA